MDFSILYGVPNESFFDSYWSVVHFVTGIVLGWALIYLYAYLKRPVTKQVFVSVGFSILLIWEYFEVVLRYLDIHRLPLAYFLEGFLPHGFFEVENTINILGDLILGGLGLYLVYYFWKKDQDHQ